MNKNKIYPKKIVLIDGMTREAIEKLRGQKLAVATWKVLKQVYKEQREKYPNHFIFLTLSSTNRRNKEINVRKIHFVPITATMSLKIVPINRLIPREKELLIYGYQSTLDNMLTPQQKGVLVDEVKI